MKSKSFQSFDKYIHLDIQLYAFIQKQFWLTINEEFGKNKDYILLVYQVKLLLYRIFISI